MREAAEHESQRPWRAMLAQCWAVEAARRDARLCRGGPQETADWAQHALTRADMAAGRCVDGDDGDARWELAAAAALALEACAATWRAFGPAAGARQVHLVGRIERRLIAHEQLALAAEAGYGLDRHALTRRAHAARLAIEHLRRRTRDTTAALATLEHATVAFSSAAIRAIDNIDATGRADGRPGRARPPATVGLKARFAEIDVHAESLMNPRYRSDVATWLSECLVITTPAIEPDPRAPRSGRPRATEDRQCGDRRRRWLRLGARELLIAHWATWGTSARLDPCSCDVVCATAAAVLADTGLAARVDALDAQLAWECQLAALSPLIPACARALQGDTDAAHRVRDRMVDRLARVVSVLWVIDHQAPRRTDEQTDTTIPS